MSAIPVICDRCRATGHAGEEPFADLAGLLSFTPVPRRPHANGWTPEYQRAFIAALAATGSAPRAARAIGKHAFGAEQLRRARGGSSFAAAWDAALELARERELAGLHDGLAELAAEQDEERGRRRSAILPAAERSLELPSRTREDTENQARLATSRFPHGVGSPNDDEAAFQQELRDSTTRIRSRLTRARRLYLAMISDDPAKRAAWELLVGPVDWDRAVRLGPQDDEPFADKQNPGSDLQPHNANNPGFLLTAEAGLIPDVAGGHDKMAEVREQLAKYLAEAAHSPEEGASQSCRDRGRSLSGGEASNAMDEKETAAIAAHRDRLKAEGWTEDDHGNLWSPEQDQ